MGEGDMVPEEGPQVRSAQSPEQGTPQYPPQYQQQYSPQYPQQGPPQYPQEGPPRPPQRRDEKQDEKQGEKEQEKKQEKGRNLDEKYHRNPLGFVVFALLVIWLGITLLLQNAVVIEDGDRGWAIFFWGGGVLILGEALMRLVVPRFRRPVLGSFIWGAIWLGIGFGLWYDRWEVIGPIVIIAIGVAILAGRLVPRK
jgi:hypothetical protein